VTEVHVIKSKSATGKSAARKFPRTTFSPHGVTTSTPGLVGVHGAVLIFKRPCLTLVQSVQLRVVAAMTHGSRNSYHPGGNLLFFLEIIYLNLRHPTNRQYLQRPQKPDRAACDYMI